MSGDAARSAGAGAGASSRGGGADGLVGGGSSGIAGAGSATGAPSGSETGPMGLWCIGRGGIGIGAGVGGGSSSAGAGAAWIGSTGGSKRANVRPSGGGGGACGGAGGGGNGGLARSGGGGGGATSGAATGPRCRTRGDLSSTPWVEGVWGALGGAAGEEAAAPLTGEGGTTLAGSASAVGAGPVPEGGAASRSPFGLLGHFDAGTGTTLSPSADRGNGSVVDVVGGGVAAAAAVAGEGVAGAAATPERATRSRCSTTRCTSALPSQSARNCRPSDM